MRYPKQKEIPQSRKGREGIAKEEFNRCGLPDDGYFSNSLRFLCGLSGFAVKNSVILMLLSR
jgi:hypothetical protein